MEEKVDESCDDEVSGVEDSGVHENKRFFLINSAHEGHRAEHEGHVSHAHGETGLSTEEEGRVLKAAISFG